MGRECKSYDAHGRICADGFIQIPFCRGLGGCLQCGTVKTLPHCQSDELPAHMAKDDGSPRFYRKASHD